MLLDPLLAAGVAGIDSGTGFQFVAFGPDTLGGIAAVGDEADLLLQAAKGSHQTGGGDHCEVGTVGLALKVIAVSMKIEQQRGTGKARGFVKLALEHPGSGGGAPVDAAEWIARLVGSHATQQRGVFEQAVGEVQLRPRHENYTQHPYAHPKEHSVGRDERGR